MNLGTNEVIDELVVYHKTSKTLDPVYDDLEAGIYFTAILFMTLIFAILVKYLGRLGEHHLEEVEPDMKETEMMKV